MTDPSAGTPIKKKTTVTAEEIARFLEQTGFVFEMRMNEVFTKAEYKTQINDEFLDLEQNTGREIDILATKRVNDIDIHFVVECKQSLTDKWVFICNKGMPRVYYAIKHLPRINLAAMRIEQPFSRMHYFDRRVPLAYNYLCYTIAGGKKSEHKQIDECVYKLPKALVFKAANAGGGTRHLFFPVALFSGQIFAVAYKGQLIVEEHSFLQYSTPFTSEAYKPGRKKSGSQVDPAVDWLHWVEEHRQEKIRTAALALGTQYSIDFVSAAGLLSYLAMVEEAVKSIGLDKWPLLEKTKTDSPVSAQS
jgi:hypothetical protein